MPTFTYTILYVNDVKATLQFYKNAFGFAEKFITLEGDYGELDTGATTLAFANYSVAEYNGVAIQKVAAGDVPPPVEVAFVVDDVAEAFMTATAAGAAAVTKPTQKPWGQTVAYVRDVNGFLVELCTSVKSV